MLFNFIYIINLVLRLAGGESVRWGHRPRTVFHGWCPHQPLMGELLLL